MLNGLRRLFTDDRPPVHTPPANVAAFPVDSLSRDIHASTVEPEVEQAQSNTFVAVAATTWAIFLVLAALIGRGKSFAWDLRLAKMIQGVHWLPFANLMHAISLPGFSPFSYLTVGGTAALLWRLHFRLESAFCVLALGAEIIGWRIKMAIRRRRPGAPQIRVFRPLRDPSFPSGHTLHYVSFYGFLSYLVFTRFRATWLRNGVLAGLASLVFLVGPSRVYRGDHWPSDVLASYCSGLPYLVGLIELYRSARALAPSGRAWSRRDPRRLT
jgi:membrane-associated phospholipid phosphatase